MDSRCRMVSWAASEGRKKSGSSWFLKDALCVPNREAWYDEGDRHCQATWTFTGQQSCIEGLYRCLWTTRMRPLSAAPPL